MVGAAAPPDSSVPHGRTPLVLLLAALVIAAADMTATSGLPEREPAAVGMSSARLSTIDRVVQRGIDAGGYPGAAVVVGRKGYSVLSRGFGALDWSGRSRVSSRESLYDLASLTKVVATTTAIMVLFDAGKVDIDAPVSRYLPDFSGGRRDQVTVRHLLTHRAGLPAGRELWRIAKTPAEARAAVLASPIQCTPGSCYEYSDLGADLLGFVAEAVSGQSLDAFLERQENFVRKMEYNLERRLLEEEAEAKKGLQLCQRSMQIVRRKERLDGGICMCVCVYIWCMYVSYVFM